MMFQRYLPGLMLIISICEMARGQSYIASTGSDAGNDCSNSTNPCVNLAHAVAQNPYVVAAAGVYQITEDIPPLTGLLGVGPFNDDDPSAPYTEFRFIGVSPKPYCLASTEVGAIFQGFDLTQCFVPEGEWAEENAGALMLYKGGRVENVVISSSIGLPPRLMAISAPFTQEEIELQDVVINGWTANRTMNLQSYAHVQINNLEMSGIYANDDDHAVFVTGRPVTVRGSFVEFAENVAGDFWVVEDNQPVVANHFLADMEFLGVDVPVGRVMSLSASTQVAFEVYGLAIVDCDTGPVEGSALTLFTLSTEPNIIEFCSINNIRGGLSSCVFLSGGQEFQVGSSSISECENGGLLFNGDYTFNNTLVYDNHFNGGNNIDCELGCPTVCTECETRCWGGEEQFQPEEINQCGCIASNDMCEAGEIDGDDSNDEEICKRLFFESVFCSSEEEPVSWGLEECLEVQNPDDGVWYSQTVRESSSGFDYVVYNSTTCVGDVIDNYLETENPFSRGALEAARISPDNCNSRTERVGVAKDGRRFTVGGFSAICEGSNSATLIVSISFVLTCLVFSLVLAA